MTMILCAKCGQGIKNAKKEAKKHQRGEQSSVVVIGPDVYHKECAPQQSS